MNDEVAIVPEVDARSCAARTRAGASCRAPPLTDSRFCTFHDPRPEIVALMDKARGKGLQRERVLAHNGEPLPVDLKDADQLRAFERGVLKRLLAGAIAPLSARAAVDLARDIVAAERNGSAERGSLVNELVARVMAHHPRPIDDEEPMDESALSNVVDSTVSS